MPLNEALVGKRVLVRIPCFGVDEYIIDEISPSKQWVNLRNRKSDRWFSVLDIELVEELPDIPSPVLPSKPTEYRP